MTGLHKFLICLLSVVVAVSLGVTVYYFARSSNEVLSLSEASLSENLGDEFTITIKQENANKHTALDLQSKNTDVVEFVKKDGLVYTFKAKAAGTAVISLITSNEEFKNENCVVTVADGINTPYFIRTAEDLLKINKDDFGLDKKYQQVDNIDLNNKAFTPIGPNDAEKFSGNYNGGNYQISNITLSIANTYAGLFGITSEDAVISNVVVNDMMITGTAKYVGAVVAYNNGKVLNSAATGSSLVTTAADSYAGGVAGVNNNEVLACSFTDGKIATASYLGGVVALNQNARVQESYARGNFKPSIASKMGGVVALNQAATGLRSNVVNNYSTMKNADTTNGNIGMVLYSNVNSDNSPDYESSTKNRVYGNYYVTTQGYNGIYANADSGIFVGALNDKTQQSYKTYAKDGSNATWNFTRIWAIDSTLNDGYAIHQNNAAAYAENVYISGIDPDEPQTPADASAISTKEQLLALASQSTYGGVTYSWDNSYYLAKDIDMSGATWAAIDNYKGTFDGKGKTISNIKINGSFVNELSAGAAIKDVTFTNVIAENRGAALVYTNKGTVYKVNINNLTVNTPDSAFAAVVHNNSGTVEVVTVNNISGTFTNQFAGIVYTNDNGAKVEDVKVLGGSTITINNPSNTGIYFGGVAIWNNGTIKNAKADISCNANLPNASLALTYIGGIVAVNGANAIVEKVNYVGNTLKLTSSNTNAAEYLGGIAGSNKGEIVDAYVKANALTLETTHSYAYLGGIAGIVEGNAVVKQVKVEVATLSSSAYAGGLAGLVNGAKVEISTSGIVREATINAKYVAGLVATFKKGLVTNCYAMATINGTEQSSGMANELASGAKVENSYIATAFGNEAKGKKFETQTKIRQGQGGSVSNNVINETVMGGYGKGDGKRQYGNDYIRFNLWIIDYEFNTPNDNLYSDSSCKQIATFTNKNWSTSDWTFSEGTEPVTVGPTIIE